MSLKNNRPEATYYKSGVSVTVWRNDKGVNFSIDKRYRDKDSGEWKDSGCFFPEDVLTLQQLIDVAYQEHVVKERRPQSAEEAGGF